MEIISEDHCFSPLHMSSIFSLIYPKLIKTFKGLVYKIYFVYYAHKNKKQKVSINFLKFPHINCLIL
jgi:hypothetical protein